MFNLDQAISEWRRKMADGGIKSRAVLDELESHLREDVEREMNPGSGEAKAFEAAVRRLGESRLLKAEFAKINRFKWSRPGQIIGIALCALAGIIVSFTGPAFFTVHEMTMSQRLVGMAAVALTLLAITSWRFSHRYLPVIRHRWLRMAAGLTCGVAGVVWLYAFFNVIVPRAVGNGAALANSFVVFNLFIAFVWAIAITAVLGGMAYGLEEAAHRQNRKKTYV